MRFTKTTVPKGRIPSKRYLVSSCSNYLSFIGIYDIEIEEQILIEDTMYIPIKTVPVKNEQLNKAGVSHILFVDNVRETGSIYLKTYVEGDDFKAYLREQNINDVLDDLEKPEEPKR